MERSRNQYLCRNANSFNVSSTYNQSNTHIIVNPTITRDEISQILSWLSPLEPWKRHHDVAANRFAGVGEWVLEAGEFQAWRCRMSDPVDAILFCYGAPGVGKTFNCSLAIDRLCDETAGRNVGVACLYCDYCGQEGQMPADIIGSLLKQFVAGLPGVPGDIHEAFRAAKGQLGRRAPQLPKLTDLFPKVLALYEQAFIFVDALDELRIEHRVEFIRSLRQIIRTSPNTRLFITGRVHVLPELDRHLTKSLLMLSVRTKDEDLRTYLKKRLDFDPDPDAMDSDLKSEIFTHLPRKFSGIFLPIAWKTDTILGETTIHNRREALYREADVLGGVYSTTLERIRGQHGSKSRLGIAVLMSISSVGRALHVDELYRALALNRESRDSNVKKVPSIQTLLGSCLGLVTFDRETSTVRLVYTMGMAPHGNTLGGIPDLPPPTPPLKSV